MVRQTTGALNPSLDLPDRYLTGLSIALLCYAVIGKGFAYLGFPPLFIGELMLALGAVVFLMCRCTIAVFATLPGFLLALLMAITALRVIPDIDDYGVDALRDTVIVMYGAYAFIVIALLLSRPQRITTALRNYGIFCFIFAFAAPVALYLSQFEKEMIPTHWNAGVPILSVRGGEVGVHLAGVAIFALAGFIKPGWIWRLALLAGAILVASISRGGLLAFAIPLIVAMIAFGRVKEMLRYSILAAPVLLAVYVLGSVLNFDSSVTTRHGRAVGFDQIAANIESIFERDDDTSSTAQWRIQWWTKIIDKTVFGQHFWGGRGFGINLALDDGVSDGTAEEGQPPVRSPHNASMTVLARLGVPVFILWVATLASWFATLGHAAIMARRRDDESWARLFIFVACYGLAFFINASFDVALEGPMQGIWFWCVFGLGLGAVMIYHRAPGDEPLISTGGAPRPLWPRDKHKFRSLSPSLLLACTSGFCATTFPGHPANGDQARIGVHDRPCPNGAIDVLPGQLNQDFVHGHGEGAAFCLKNGVHRLAVIRPLRNQRFYGEGRSVLSGAREIRDFKKEGRFWVADWTGIFFKPHGQCLEGRDLCDRPEGVFLDDTRLVEVASKDRLVGATFFLDRRHKRLYLAVDPNRRRIDVTAARFAFQSSADDVLISNLIVEKYASRAQSGAIHGREGNGWRVVNSDVRQNSGCGINVGDEGRVIASKVHDNGQLGISGAGTDIVIEENQIWGNNTKGFQTAWEAGGVKIVRSDGVSFRRNHVYDNVGPGLWCDIECRNVTYEENLIEGNHRAGIFHEISFAAVVRNNVLRHNSVSDRGNWYWGSEILIAGSQNVDIYKNKLTVGTKGCAIMLVDQSRSDEAGGKYKTRGNTVRNNEATFEGDLCTGGVSDADSSDVNFNIIAGGNNKFEANRYHVRRSSTEQTFVWGHRTYDWRGFRRLGMERAGSLNFF